MVRPLVKECSKVAPAYRLSILLVSIVAHHRTAKWTDVMEHLQMVKQSARETLRDVLVSHPWIPLDSAVDSHRTVKWMAVRVSSRTDKPTAKEILQVVHVFHL
jgi:hypothetical protein